MLAIGDKRITPYYGNYKPVEVRRNNVKLAGWKRYAKTGTLLSFGGTYNDKVESLIIPGKTAQNGTPTPSAPIPITGVHPSKVTAGGVDYHLSLSAPLYDGDYVDVISGAELREKNVKIFTGSNSNGWLYARSTNTVSFYRDLNSDAAKWADSTAYCTHLKRSVGVVGDSVGFTGGDLGIRVFMRVNWATIGATTADSDATLNTKFDNWLAAEYNRDPINHQYAVMVVYKRATPAAISLTPMTIATIPQHTDISADGAEITATVKVVDTTL